MGSKDFRRSRGFLFGVEDQLIRKSFSATIKSTSESEDGKFGYVEAIVSVFVVKDSHGERMHEDCATESLQQRIPKAVWMHNWQDPIAKTMEARVLRPGDPLLPDKIKEYGGLYIKARFSLDSTRSKDAYIALRDEHVDEYSVGYFEKDRREEIVSGDRDVTILKIDWREWSPVLFGSNPDTSTLSVKGARGATFADHSEQVLGSLQGLLARAKDISSKRSEKDGSLAKERIADLKAMHDELGALLTVLEAPSEEEVTRAKAEAVLLLATL